jgi:opacity protein-like surface antigen
LLLASGSIVAQENDAQGNFKVLIGQKSLKADDWEPIENQLQFGAMLDFTTDAIPVNFVFGVFYSSDETTEGPFTLSGNTIDFLFGVNKYFVTNSNFQPYIGLGGVFTAAELKLSGYGDSNSADGNGIGFWVGGGFQILVTPNIALGADLRYSQVEVKIEETEGEGGGLQYAVFVGYHF